MPDHPRVLDLVARVNATGAALADHVHTPRADPLVSNPTWIRLSMQWSEALQALQEAADVMADGLAWGDATAAAPALDYLEADPYYFRSGYTRNRLTRRLSLVTLPFDLGTRARTHILAVVDGRRHCSMTALGHLARSVADNGLRRALRLRLRSTNPHVADRALRSITWVRRPGLSDDERRVTQDLLLAQVVGTPWLTPSSDRIARWLWTPDWEAQLRDLVRHHDPYRAPARTLLAASDRRRARRPGP